MIKKYNYLPSQAYHSFTPVAFETSGICGPRSMSFLTDLDRHIANTTGDKAIRRGNAASILGTLPPTLSTPLNDV